MLSIGSLCICICLRGLFLMLLILMFSILEFLSQVSLFLRLCILQILSFSLHSLSLLTFSLTVDFLALSSMLEKLSVPLVELELEETDAFLEYLSMGSLRSLRWTLSLSLSRRVLSLGGQDQQPVGREWVVAVSLVG